MPRVSEPVDDTTSLDGSRIDVGARIGWLLRVSRTAAGLSLRDMSAALEQHGVTLSAASLSRIESEGHRSVAALEGYARVLGLAEGSLRLAVDYLCRSFSYAPPTTVPSPPPTLERFTAACLAVDADRPTAGDWLAFSRQHADGTGFGLPAHLMAPYVRRLALELCRSVGPARFLRYEALLDLRRGAYGDLVVATVVEVLDEPGIQVVDDLVNMVAECPAREVVVWVGERLRHPSVLQVRAASYAIQGMLVTGGLELDDWRDLPAAFDRAWPTADADPLRRAALAELRGALPPPLQHQITSRERTTSPVTGPRVWTRSRRNLHYGFAAGLSRAVTTARGLPDDPMLARLLFESLFDPRGVRKSTSTMLLAASPFSCALVLVLLESRTGGPDDGTRAAAARVAAFCHLEEELPDLDSLLAADNPEEFRHALRFFGHAGRPLPDGAVERGLAGDEILVGQTMVALGLAGDHRLTLIAADPDVPEPTRAAAQWWLRHGSRIVS